MLLVHGMNRDIFYGTAEFGRDGIQTLYGVGQDLTVNSQSSQLNVNYASRAALLSVQGMTEELAESIIQERGKGPFESLGRLNETSGDIRPGRVTVVPGRDGRRQDVHHPLGGDGQWLTAATGR